MRCTNCGNEVASGSVYCPYCRSKISGQDTNRADQTYNRTYQNGTSYNSTGNKSQDPVWEQAADNRRSYSNYNPAGRNLTEDDLPPELKPMSAWAYVGWGILFSIPIAGFVLLLVFSFADGNVNRKHFARSYWCWLLIAVIILLILAVAGIVTTGSFSEWLQELAFRFRVFR